MTSLQDQLLKSGLVNEKQAKSAKKQKRKEDKAQYKSKEQVVNETKLAAQQKAREKVEQDRKLNAEHETEKNRKALVAQANELIKINRKARGDGDVAYHFSDSVKVTTI